MKILFFILTFAFGFAIFSANAEVNDSIVFKKATKPISFHLNAGSMFMSSFKNGGSAMNTYIAPQFSYSLSRRFIFDAGFAIVNSNFTMKNFSKNESTHKTITANYTSTYVYFGGRYLLNDHIIISGQTYSEVGTPKNNLYSDKLHNYNFKGANLGIDYQLNENSSIGIHFNYSNDNNMFSTSPFSFQNPF